MSSYAIERQEMLTTAWLAGMRSDTSEPGRYFELECFSCGEVAEAQSLGKTSPLCSCGLPYSVEMRIRKGRPSLSIELRAALWWALTEWGQRIYKGFVELAPSCNGEPSSVPATGLVYIPDAEGGVEGQRAQRARARAALAGLGGALGSLRRKQ